jgi:hypothetical protein
MLRRESVRGSLVCGLRTWGWMAWFVWPGLVFRIGAKFYYEKEDSPSH